MGSHVEVAKELQQQKGIKVGVYRRDNFPGKNNNEVLYEGIKNIISKNAYAVYIDDLFLALHKPIFGKYLDIIIIPEIEKMPESSYRYIKKYLQLGGALVLSGSNLLLEDAEVNKLNKVFDFASCEEYLRRTVGHLGIKPYKTDILPKKAGIDTDFLPGLPVEIDISLPRDGVYLNTSSDKNIPKPCCGNVFPERYPVLRNYVVARGVDPFGTYLNSAVVFGQNWENGSRVVVSASNSKDSLMDPSNSYFEAFIQGIYTFCKNRVCVSYVEPGFACYKNGEAVSVQYTLNNFGSSSEEVEVLISIKGTNDDGYEQVEHVNIPANGSVSKEVFWNPDDFKSDYYDIDIRITDGNRLLSKVSNGFVVWLDEVALKGPEIKLCGKYFKINEKPSIITGTNYYESNIGELMWIRPDVRKLKEDLSDMSDKGINYIRIHFHHPKWFHDYLKHNWGAIPEYFKDVPNTYLPNEKILRIFDAHIYLCQKYGIVYGGDLFTLLPEEMGDPRGWFYTQDYAVFEEKIACQKEFIKLLMKRYTQIPGIAWDLYNEPYGGEDPEFDDIFQEWAKKITEVARLLGDKHLITVGSDRFDKYEEVLDFYAGHKNYKNFAEMKQSTNKPEIVQEAWLDRNQTPEGDQLQFGDMKHAIFTSYGLGYSGFAPWQWTNQARLWNDNKAGNPEIWDDNLGCCVRNDGTQKPAGRLFMDFSLFAKGMSFNKHENNSIFTDKGILKFNFYKEEPRDMSYSLVEHEEGKLLCGLTKGMLICENKPILQSDQECDIWYYTDDAGGITVGKDLYVKTYTPCKLKIFYTSEKPSFVSLCDSTIDRRELESVDFIKGDEFIEIEVKDWHINYWFHIKRF